MKHSTVGQLVSTSSGGGSSLSYYFMKPKKKKTRNIDSFTLSKLLRIKRGSAMRTGAGRNVRSGNSNVTGLEKVRAWLQPD